MWENESMDGIVEILTMHSMGERDGRQFSPATLPYSVLALFVDNLKNFVVGGHGTGDEREKILADMEVSQRTGSWTVGVLLSSTWLSSAPIQSLKADLKAISARRFDAIADASRARAFRALRAGMAGRGISHFGILSKVLNISETDILPHSGEEESPTEIWLDAERYFPASPKINVQLELDGWKTVRADPSVAGFGDIGASVPEGTLLVRIAYQFNPKTNERRNERIVEVVRRSRVFDEEAFDDMASKPNGWSSVADPVAEIRRMRDGDA